MSKQLINQGRTNNDTQAENKIDVKNTETDCTHEFTRQTQGLCFTTYVVTTMKSLQFYHFLLIYLIFFVFFIFQFFHFFIFQFFFFFRFSFFQFF